MKTQENLRYRKNVGLMIINQKGQIWLGKRTDWKKFQYNEQMPQGGIDANETPEKAALRELYEETGLTPDKVKLLSQSKEWHSYCFPHQITFGNNRYWGQTQKWFLFLFMGNESDFNLSAHPEEIEFVSYKWYEPNDILERVVPFKREIYQEILLEFSEIINDIAQKSRSS